MTEQQDKDRERKVEQASLFVHDLARMIEQRGPAVTKQMEPFKKRRLRNHFIDEARAIYGEK